MKDVEYKEALSDLMILSRTHRLSPREFSDSCDALALKHRQILETSKMNTSQPPIRVALLTIPFLDIFALTEMVRFLCEPVLFTLRLFINSLFKDGTST